MDTFLYVLLGWIVLLYVANKLRSRRKPKTVKIMVKRNGNYQEVDAILLAPSIKMTEKDNESNYEFSLKSSGGDPYTMQNYNEPWAIALRELDNSKDLIK
ncbi:hypothetical protein [Pseudenterobacter timonensis]|uniref:hypothetical protein n=1 Tax=Pseudenterobacter timonensis TaxID=1755099 RepID=UPI00077B81A5|nr:hypothetical protein [Pseudenterobacter timonensis]